MRWMMNRVYLLPVGNVKEEILKRLLPCLEERFLFGFTCLPVLSVPGNAYNVVKRKYLSPVICEKIKSEFPEDARFVLGITDVDTYDNSSNLIYNFTHSEDRVGLVSLYRLNPAFSGRASDEDLFFQRVLKEVVHELGHLIGFRHCFNSLCPMYFSYSINDTDKKGSFFCGECEKKLNRITNNF